MEKSEIIDRQVKRKITITDEDVERYYKANPNKYKSNERARIRHILLSLPENAAPDRVQAVTARSEEHTSELQSRRDLVCRLLLEPATTEIYTLSLHDALPIYGKERDHRSAGEEKDHHHR